MPTRITTRPAFSASTAALLVLVFLIVETRQGARELRRTRATLREQVAEHEQTTSLLTSLVQSSDDSIVGLDERVGAFEKEMNGGGRVLIRYSGTESLARVMIEGADASRIQAMADELAGVIKTQIGQ